MNERVGGAWRQRLRVSHVRLDGRSHRVLRPDRPAPRAVLYPWSHGLEMFVDRRAADQLATAWGLAARSPRSLVYLPLRGNPPPEGFNDDEGRLARVDLVLLHHSLQFPPADWKRVRARLRPGRVHTASVRDVDLGSGGDVDYDRWYFREFRDHLRFTLAVGTLFVVGSRTAFLERGDLVRSLTTRAPSYRSRGPGDHYCVELNSGSFARPNVRPPVPADLHVQYCPRWRL